MSEKSEKIWKKAAQTIVKAGYVPFPINDNLINLLKVLMTEEQAEFVHQVFKKASLRMDQIKERTDLEKYARKLNVEDNIRFIGNVSNENVLTLINKSDVLVLPSLSEGFPRVILEGMLCGIPIVASNVRGIKEIIEDGKNGFLFKARDAFQLSDKI